MELLLIMLAVGVYSWWSENKKKPEEDKGALPPIVKREEKKGAWQEVFQKKKEDVEKEWKRMQDESREIFETVKEQPQTLSTTSEKEVRPTTTEVLELARQEREEVAALDEQITVYEDTWTKPKKELKQEDLLPKTEQDLVRGVIFSEIMSPPKSKRHRR